MYDEAVILAVGRSTMRVTLPVARPRERRRG